MLFGNDDDSVLSKLFHELDMSSALHRLERVGFKLIASRKKHHVRRTREHSIEDIFIELDVNGHFIVQFAMNGLLASYTDTITSWDEWVIFVRLLMLRSPTEKQRHLTIEEPQYNMQEEPKGTNGYFIK